MKIFFAGTESQKNRNIMKKAGAANLLHSAYASHYKADIRHISKEFNLLMDSGGYTLRRNNQTLDPSIYAKFINYNNIKLAFELDVADLKTTLENQDYLLKHTKATIVPIYHFDDFDNFKTREILLDYIKKFSYIGIGGVAGTSALTKSTFSSFMNYVFRHTRDKIKVHALGITNRRLPVKYPFYSLDSTTWLNGGRYGTYIIFDKRRVRQLISLKIRYRKLKDKTKPEKIFNNADFRMISDEETYAVKAVEAFLKFENYLTELWERRGVKWKD